MCPGAWASTILRRTGLSRSTSRSHVCVGYPACRIFMFWFRFLDKLPCNFEKCMVVIMNIFTKRTKRQTRVFVIIIYYYKLFFTRFNCLYAESDHVIEVKRLIQSLAFTVNTISILLSYFKEMSLECVVSNRKS